MAGKKGGTRPIKKKRQIKTEIERDNKSGSKSSNPPTAKQMQEDIIKEADAQAQIVLLQHALFTQQNTKMLTDRQQQTKLEKSLNVKIDSKVASTKEKTEASTMPKVTLERIK